MPTDDLATPPNTDGRSKAAARDVHRSWKLARALQLLERLQWSGPGHACPVCKGLEKKKKKRGEAEAEADAPAPVEGAVEAKGHASSCTIGALLSDRAWEF